MRPLSLPPPVVAWHTPATVLLTLEASPQPEASETKLQIPEQLRERYSQMLWVGSWSGGDVLGVGLVGLAPFL